MVGKDIELLCKTINQKHTMGYDTLPLLLHRYISNTCTVVLRYKLLRKRAWLTTVKSTREKGGYVTYMDEFINIDL